MSRNTISMTAIKQLSKMFNHTKEEKLTNDFLTTPSDREKKRPSKYTLKKVEFNIISRITRIEILQTQEYRTIQKYITQNYEKYPIYSDWKIKEKTIKKTLKLTNLELELLNTNSDSLIKMFAEEIVLAIDIEELLPSWFIKLYLKRELNYILKNIKNNLDNFLNTQKNKIANLQNEIYKLKIEINNTNKVLNKTTNKRDKKTKILQKITNAKPKLYKSILSFGIYNYFISTKRKLKIEEKLLKNEKTIKNLLESIAKNNEKIDKYKKDIHDYELKIEEENKNYSIEKDKKTQEYNKKLSEVRTLSNTMVEDESFIMLKSFGGLEYEKIIGVYIIHNKEKDKYYVGQSKDVMKRIKQHFSGTVPKNIIFAEDYYNSQLANKDNIFEIKIIKCCTKDELDKLEKSLIYEYDSWNNGYNGTSGNI